jgi:hypothetical protein
VASSGIGGTGITQEIASGETLMRPEGGMGGTGLEGIGGTGLGGDDDGIGGTGMSGGQDGIGGTGIFGTITAFGSVCVNGLRVHYDADTPVTVNGRRGSAQGLAVGQVVAVDATATRSGLRARSLDVRSAVVGPVTAVDAERGRIRVLGQSVAVPHDVWVSDAAGGPPSPLASLEPGRFVDVSGLRRSDGVVVASRIGGVRDGTEVTVAGPATSVAAGALYVSGLRVEVRAEAPDAVRTGRPVRVRGRWNAETSSLESARIAPEPHFGARVERVSVEGYVQERRGESGFRLTGLDVDTSGLARPLPEGPGHLRVRVRGRLTADGELRAERIEIDRRSSLPELAGGDSVEGGSDDAEERSEREDRSGRDERSDRDDRGDRSGRSERVDRAERPQRAARPERPARSSR